MKNLYEVQYKRNSHELDTVSVVASSPSKAIDGAKIVIRKRHYGYDREIILVTKKLEIDRVE